MKKLILIITALFFVVSCGNETSIPKVSKDDNDFKKELAIQKEIYKKEQVKNDFFDKYEAKPLFKNYFDYQMKLANIMLPILKSSKDFCKFTGYNSGVVVGKTNNVNYNISRFKNYPVVIGTVDGFAKGTQNLKKGDVIVKVNGKSMIDKENNMATFTNENYNSKVLSLKIYRKSENKYYSLKIISTPICKVPYFLTREKMYNAYANDKGVFISIKMMDFLEKDDYIANVMAHELSHNIMVHSKKMNDKIVYPILAIEIIGDALGIDQGVKELVHFSNAVAIFEYSLSYESEADYIGGYIIARTKKFDIDQIPYTWRRMIRLAKSEKDLSEEITHPSGPARFVGLNRTVKEIKKKIKTKQALVPNTINGTFDDIKKNQKEINVFDVYKGAERLF